VQSYKGNVDADGPEPIEQRFREVQPGGRGRDGAGSLRKNRLISVAVKLISFPIMRTTTDIGW